MIERSVNTIHVLNGRGVVFTGARAGRRDAVISGQDIAVDGGRTRA